MQNPIEDITHHSPSLLTTRPPNEPQRAHHAIDWSANKRNCKIEEAPIKHDSLITSFAKEHSGEGRQQHYFQQSSNCHQRGTHTQKVVAGWYKEVRAAAAALKINPWRTILMWFATRYWLEAWQEWPPPLPVIPLTWSGCACK